MGSMTGKIIKYILPLSILLGAFLMINGQKPTSNNDQEANIDYEIYVNEVIKAAREEIERESNLICIGSGGGMPYDVEEISLKFMAYQRPTLEEARRLHLFATEKLLEKINSHEKIRPFLREYPFKYDRVFVSITYWDKNNDYHEQGITLVFNIGDKIRYKQVLPNTELFESFHEETFEEAKKNLR